MGDGKTDRGWGELTGLSRRDFLGAAALGGATLLLAVAPFRVARAADGRKLIYSTGYEYETLDPHVKYDVPAAAFGLNMYDNLYRYEGNPIEIVPWLAEKHEVTPDGKKWTFHLRKGVKFHDGSEVTADAVVSSFDRLLAIGKGPASAFKPVLEKGDVRALDRSTVEFHLKKPFGPFMATIPMVAIVNPAVLKAHEQAGDLGAKWLASNEAGSGAYKLVRYSPATGFSMTKNPDYWRGWSGKHVDEVEVRIVREAASRVLALMKGEVNMLDTYLAADQIDKIAKSPTNKVIPQESMRIFVFRMNNRREPFTDINVRQALSYAFNYDAFIKDIMRGQVVRNPGPLPKNLWGWPKDLKGYEFSLDKAKESLAKAPVKVNRPLEMHIQSESEITVQAASLFQSDLAKIGVELKIVKSTWATLVAATRSVETTPDLWIHWVSTYYADPDNWVGQMYDSSNWGAWKASCWYKNPKVDELLQHARNITNQAERAKLYSEAVKQVVADAPDIWIYNTVEYGLFTKNVMGWKFCPVGSGQEWWHMYLEA